MFLVPWAHPLGCHLFPFFLTDHRQRVWETSQDSDWIGKSKWKWETYPLLSIILVSGRFVGFFLLFPLILLLSFFFFWSVSFT